jgi:hypothetical protein
MPYFWHWIDLFGIHCDSSCIYRQVYCRDATVSSLCAWFNEHGLLRRTTLDTLSANYLSITTALAARYLTLELLTRWVPLAHTDACNHSHASQQSIARKKLANNFTAASVPPPPDYQAIIRYTSATAYSNNNDRKLRQYWISFRSRLLVDFGTDISANSWLLTHLRADFLIWIRILFPL